MENFTPYSALVGGALIGTAATLLLLFNGSIAGISGIVAGSFVAFQKKSYWVITFLIGMLSGAFLFRIIWPESFELTIDASHPVLVLAGLLVGFGTRLGNGCTSGHGVCGIARFSKRSIVATITFMLSGFITVFFIRHILGG